jgi:hypothetical protein
MSAELDFCENKSSPPNASPELLAGKLAPEGLLEEKTSKLGVGVVLSQVQTMIRLPATQVK